MILKPLGIVESDPLSIHLNGDNDSSISANILFPQGITIPDYVANEKLVFGSTSPKANMFLVEEPGLYRLLYLQPETATSGQLPVSYYWQAGNSNQTAVDGGSGQFVAGSVIGGTGTGGNFLFGAGGGRGAGFSGGLVLFSGGIATSSATYGWVQVGTLDTPTPKFSLSSTDAIQSLIVNKHLQVDGSTYLASLTGILKGTSGLVAVASGADLASAISVTSPITNAGSIGFDFGTNNIWTNSNLFQSELSVADDVKFYIGDNSGAAGNIYFLADISNSGNVLLAPDNGYAKSLVSSVPALWTESFSITDSPSSGGPYLNIGDDSQGSGFVSIQMDAVGSGNIMLQPKGPFAGYWSFESGLSVNIVDNLYFGNGSHSTIALFGSTLTAPQATPSGATHGLFVRKKQSTTSGLIAGVLEAEFSSTSASASQVQALNIFAHNTSNAANLTNTTNGGGLRSRAVTRQRSTVGTIAQMSNYSLNLTMDASTATVSLGTPLNVEAPTIGSAATMTEFRGINFQTAAISGTVTTAKYIHMPALTYGSTAMEMFFDTDAGSFYRASTQQINSRAANELDIDANTTLNLRIGGTVEATLSSTLLNVVTNDVAIASGAKFYFEGSGGDTYAYYDSGSSSLKFYVNGALAMELK